MNGSQGCWRLNADEIAAETFGDEVIMIHLGTAQYFSIRGVAQFAWERLVQGVPADEVGLAIGRYYDVDPERADRDLERLVEQFQQERLLLPLEEPRSSTVAPASMDERPAEVKLPYAAPVMEVHHELGELLAIDPPLPRRPQRSR